MLYCPGALWFVSSFLQIAPSSLFSSVNLFIHLMLIEHVQGTVPRGTGSIVVNKVGDILAVIEPVYPDLHWGGGLHSNS